MSHFTSNVPPTTEDMQPAADMLTQTQTQTAFSAGFAQMERSKFVPITSLYFEKNITHVYLLD